MDESTTTNSTPSPQSGSTPSCAKEQSRAGTSTPVQSSMFEDKTSQALTIATSSPESAGGRMRSNSQGGKDAARGPAHVRVSRFRARDSEKAMSTNDTSGPLFSVSSPSATFQRSLENRLRAAMDENGSPEYALTWKAWDMPSGVPICALRASVRRTSGSGSSGWPTPMAGSPATETYNAAGNTDSSRKTVALVTGWPTPRTPTGGAESAQRKQELGRKESGGGDLQAAALMVGWPTASARDWKDTPGMATTGTNPDGTERTRLDQLPRVAALAGTPAFQSSVSTENSGAFHLTKKASLNPRFSLWLMGFPTVWARCAEQVTR